MSTAISRAKFPDGRIIYVIAGSFTHDVAKELRPLLDRDLLEARGSKRGVRFVLDLADCPDIEPRALKTLEGSHRHINSETNAGLELINVSEDLYATLKTAKYTNTFHVRRVGDVPRTTPELTL